MPATETAALSLGNWTIAFYAVYAMAAVAVVTASAVLIDWSVNKVRASRLGSNANVSRRAQELGSQA